MKERCAMGEDMNPQMCMEMCFVALLLALCAKHSCFTRLNCSCASHGEAMATRVVIFSW